MTVRDEHIQIRGDGRGGLVFQPRSNLLPHPNLGDILPGCELLTSFVNLIPICSCECRVNHADQNLNYNQLRGVLVEKLIVAGLGTTFTHLLLNMMVLTCLQEPATGPYPDPDGPDM
jgi:hypothetical protein